VTKTALICIAVSLLAAAGAYAENPQETPRISREWFDASLAFERVSSGKTVALFAAQTPAAQRKPSEDSHPGRLGAWIGLGVGTALATLIWTNTNCQYGSDSFAAVVVVCMVPSGAMVAGGWFIGRAIGRKGEPKNP
jgi:hypothetical protein